MNSWEGLVIAIVLVIGILVIARYHDKTEDDKRKTNENERDVRLLESVNKTFNDSFNQRNTDLIEAINKRTDAILKAIKHTREGE